MSSLYTSFQSVCGFRKTPIFDLESEVGVQNAIEHLSHHSNPALEAGVVKASLDVIFKVVAYSLQSGKLKMLDVCQRIVQLDQLKELSTIGDVTAHAKVEAALIPLPQRNIDMISKSLLQQWHLNSGIIGKMIHYFVSTVTWSYSIDLDTPPTSRWVAQSQWSFFRSLAEDGKWAVVAFFSFFSSTWKAAMAAGTLLASLAGLKYLYHRFHVGTPENLDKRIFRNLTQEALAGALKPTIGREKQHELVRRCLTTPPGHKPAIPILVGPPGVGKTQLVEGLALSIAQGEIESLKGKKVFVVNTASLSEWGSFSEGGAYASRLDNVFSQIEGYEDQVILFFDEAHNAATASQGPGNSEGPGLIETLKTKLLERNVLCILATTTEEYDKHIATNGAFVDRTTRIDFESLSDDETRVILQEKTQFAEESPVEVTTEGIDEVLRIANTEKYRSRSNPRKSADLLQKAINHVYAWTPSEFDRQIKAKDLEYRRELAQAAAARKREPTWSTSEPGRAALAKIEGLKQGIEHLQAQKVARIQQFAQVIALRKLEPIYTRREHEVIHLLANTAADSKVVPEAQKVYLFLQHIVLPTLRKKIQEEAAKIGESMPLKVDAAVVKELFSSSST